MNPQQLKMIQLLMNLKESFEELNDFMLGNPELIQHLSFQYPFKNEDDFPTVVKKVEDWAEESIYNVQKSTTK